MGNGFPFQNTDYLAADYQTMLKSKSLAVNGVGNKLL